MKFDVLVAVTTAGALMVAGIIMVLIGSSGDDAAGILLAFLVPPLASGFVAGRKS